MYWGRERRSSLCVGEHCEIGHLRWNTRSIPSSNRMPSTLFKWLQLTRIMRADSLDFYSEAMAAKPQLLHVPVSLRLHCLHT